MWILPSSECLCLHCLYGKNKKHMISSQLPFDACCVLVLSPVVLVILDFAGVTVDFPYNKFHVGYFSNLMDRYCLVVVTRATISSNLVGSLYKTSFFKWGTTICFSHLFNYVYRYMYLLQYIQTCVAWHVI